MHLTQLKTGLFFLAHEKLTFWRRMLFTRQWWNIDRPHENDKYLSVFTSLCICSFASMHLLYRNYMHSNVPSSCTSTAILTQTVMDYSDMLCTVYYLQSPQLLLRTEGWWHVVYKWLCVDWISTCPNATFPPNSFLYNDTLRRKTNHQLQSAF